MSENETQSSGRGWPVIALAGGALLALAFLLSLLVNPSFGWAILGGVVGAGLIIGGWRFLRWLFARSKVLGVVAIILPVIACLLVAGIMLFGMMGAAMTGAGGAGEQPAEEEGETSDNIESPPPPVTCPPAVVTGVHVVVEAEDLRAGMITHGGVVTAYEPRLATSADGVNQECVEGESFDTVLPVATVEAERQGLALRQVRIASRTVSGQVDAALGDDARYPSSATVTVEVVDFPKNSFFEARAARDVEVFDFLNSQTVSWEQRSISDSIVFVYVPPGWRFARPVLVAWYQVGSLGSGIMGVVSLVVSLVVVPLLGDTLSDQLRTWWRSRSARPKAGAKSGK